MSIPMTDPVTYLLTASAAEEVTENLTLQSDMTVSGDLTLKDATIDLNGYTLTVTGDFNQPSGTVNIGTGTLNVQGDYINAVSRNNAGTGSLAMYGEGGKVNIGGDYFQWSSTVSSLTQGLMTVGGSFEGSKSDGEGGFDAYSNHEVRFVGDAVHEVYFNTPNGYNQFRYVSMSGDGQLLLKGKTNGFTAASDLVFADGSQLAEGATLYPDGHTITAAGDFTLTGAIDLGSASTFHVKGDLIQPAGSLAVMDGTLNVDGDYINAVSRNIAGTGSLAMNWDGRVNVGGDYFQWSSAVSSLTQGLMTIGGSFEGSKSDGEGGFDAYSEHEVRFVGDSIHEVYFNTKNGYNQFNRVSMTGDGQLLLRGKTNGFTAASDLVFADGSQLSEGITLSPDGHTITAAGDFTLTGAVDLRNASTFNVKGNLTQPAGSLAVVDGTLNVAGDYINAVSRNNAGTGFLAMNWEDGRVIVGGDYFQWSSTVSGLTQGILAVYGNFEGSKSGGEGGFDAYSGHTLAFLGGKSHEIYLNAVDGYNQINTIQMGAGDAITFTKELNGVANGKSVEVEPATLASVSDKTVTALADGEGTIKFIGDSTLTRTLLVGDPGLPAPFDGTIAPPSDTPPKTDDEHKTDPGEQGLANRDAFQRIQGESFDSATGSIATAGTSNPDAAASDGGVLGWINAGDYAVFQHVDFGNSLPAKNVTLRFSNNSGAPSKVSIYAGSLTGQRLATITLPATDGWNDYRSSTISCAAVLGLNDLYVVFEDGGVNLDYFQFDRTEIEQDITDPTDPPGAEYKPGDVNLDGEIDIMDVIAVNKFLLGTSKLSDMARKNADVDFNDAIDTTDSLLILKYVVALIDSFGEPTAPPAGADRPAGGYGGHPDHRLLLQGAPRRGAYLC